MDICGEFFYPPKGASREARTQRVSTARTSWIAFRWTFLPGCDNYKMTEVEENWLSIGIGHKRGVWSLTSAIKQNHGS